MHAFSKSVRTLILGLFLALPSLGWSNTMDEAPGALAMTADTLVVRPVMFVGTLVGGVLFIVSSPFSALGGNIDESWEVLVNKPFQVTFNRCLGCKRIGKKEEVINQ